MKKLFIFIDESGLTDIKSHQRYFVLAFALMNNAAFAEELIFEIKDRCMRKGRPIIAREVKYHELSPLQKEITVEVLNSRYRNFYVCFVELESANAAMVGGDREFEIQSTMVRDVLFSLNKQDLAKYGTIRVIMDKKLPHAFQRSIQKAFQEFIGTKKGVTVETIGSARQRGIQVADLIAGAFRAKLMKKSDLFEVDLRRVFQVTVPALDQFSIKRLKGDVT